jgi:hypothetical protein
VTLRGCTEASPFIAVNGANAHRSLALPCQWGEINIAALWYFCNEIGDLAERGFPAAHE